MEEYHRGFHAVSLLSVYLVWITKYRYPVLKGGVQEQCRDLLIQTCNSENVCILKGVVSKDHVHLHLGYSPSISVSMLVKKLKGRTSHHLQRGFPTLGKRYWGRHIWGAGYGVWSTGNITDAIVQEYPEHYNERPNAPTKNWVGEKE